MASAGGHSQIGNGGVFGLAAAVADHAGVAIAAAQVDRLERFAQRADLIHLDQDRIGDAQINAPLQSGAVGHEQVIAHQLH